MGLGVLVVGLACGGKTTTPDDATAHAEGTTPDHASTAEEPAPSEPEVDTQPEAEDSAGSTIDEALAAKPGLPPPTEAEFRAWDRVDPGVDERLRKWDTAHLPKLLDYADDLQCFRHRIVKAGRAHLDGKSTDEEWTNAKREHVFELDGWQKQLFMDDPRIIENSKLISRFLEAHEILSHGYPIAYNDGGGKELQRTEAHWVVVRTKIAEYVSTLGGTWKELDPEGCKSRRRRFIRGA